MSSAPMDDNVEWHMGQLRSWMIPNPTSATPTSSASTPDGYSPCYYPQNPPTSAYYGYNTTSMSYPPQLPMQRVQTFADMTDFGFDYASSNYCESPMTPGSCPPDEMGGLFDDVESCFSEAPSSFVSSEILDRSPYDSTASICTRQQSVTSQPAPALMQANNSEVDSLMKNLQPVPSLSSSSGSNTSMRSKKHTCPFMDCSKTFSQPTHLKIHLRSHTGEKPYTCSVPTCRQAFSQLGNLRTHERRHLGQRPNRKRSSSDPGARSRRYECILDSCRISTPHGTTGKAFTQLGNLKAHMNKFHKDTLARLSDHFANTDPTGEDQELRSYFFELYKNSNKGIKGRGKGRKVHVIGGGYMP